MARHKQTGDDGSKSEASERRAVQKQATTTAAENNPLTTPPKPNQHEQIIINFCSPYSAISFEHIKHKVPFKPEDIASFVISQTARPVVPCADWLEAELSRIIGMGWMQHRMDVAGEVGKLVVAERDAWKGMREDAVRAAGEVERELWLRLHRVNVAVAGLEVPKSSWDGTWNWF